jgi:WD40 repeat protein
MAALSCEQTGALLSSLLAGEVGHDLADDVAVHLAGCPACRALAEEFTWQDLALAELAGRARLSEMAATIHAALAGESATPKTPVLVSHKVGIWKSAGIAASLLMVILAWALIAQFKAPLPTPGASTQTTREKITPPVPALAQKQTPRAPVRQWDELAIRPTQPVAVPNLPPPLRVARLDRVQGEVYVVTSKPEGKTLAHSGDDLFSGQGLITGNKGSMAVVIFSDDTRLQLNANTQVDRMSEGAAAPGDANAGKSIFLAKGSLSATVKKQPEGQPMVLTAPGSEVVVLGTKFTLAAEPEATSLQVTKGRVRFTRRSDGRSIEVQQGYYAVASKDGEFKPRPLVRPNPAWVALHGPTEAVLSLAFSPDGATLATGCDDGTVKLWDMDKKSVRRTLIGHTGQVESVAFSPDGRLLVSAGWDQTVRLWDAATGTLVAPLKGHSSSVTAVAFAPDGKTLASGSFDRTVRLWDVTAHKERKILAGHTHAVRSVTFSRDGAALASGGADGMIGLWDPIVGEHRRWYTSKDGWIYCLAFSGNGHTLASGGADGSIRFWEAATSRETLSIPGHRKRVTALVYSPDGRMLASGSTDGAICFWDPATGEALRTLNGMPQEEVSALAFSPDGRTFASGSWNKTVLLWSLADLDLDE